MEIVFVWSAYEKNATLRECIFGEITLNSHREADNTYAS